MPRILPRLVRAWDKVRDSALDKPPPVLPPKRFQRIPGRRIPAKQALASLSVTDRTQSLLLDSKNVVQSRQHYDYRKSPAPKVYGQALARPVVDATRGAYGAKVRAMTEEEREWYASPYLRMLASPLRSDAMSHKIVPRDFMVRFTVVYTQGPRAAQEAQLFVPDLMEHPRYRSRIGRLGHYLVCNKAVLKDFEERQTWRKFAKNLIFNAPYFEARMSHVLRVRVLQELELLAQRLQTRPRHAGESPAIRRLTRAEWKQIKGSGIVPYENAVAIIVVPPLNKNPETRQRPTPSDSPQPVQEDGRFIPDKPLPPVCTMHPTTFGKHRAVDSLVKTHQYLPSAKIPLYHGLATFPSRVQRAALHKALNRLLDVERNARWREHGRPDHPNDSKEQNPKVDRWARGDQKGSHAYIIFSDANTILRADTVPLAIALWRIRLWEGSGWDKKTKKTSAGGWKILMPKALPS